MKATMHWDTRHHQILLEDTIIGKSYIKHCNKNVCSCPEYQQVTLKEPQYINLHLPIPQFCMSFMKETEKGNQYV